MKCRKCNGTGKEVVNEVCKECNGRGEITIDFWDSPGEEQLRFTELNEAVEMILDEIPPPLPKKIEVAGFKRMKVVPPYHEAEFLIEHLLEKLDEEYGDFDGSMNNINEFIEYAQQFIENVSAHYTPWMCEEVARETIDVKEWVEENCPHWIKEGVTVEE